MRGAYTCSRCKLPPAKRACDKKYRVLSISVHLLIQVEFSDNKIKCSIKLFFEGTGMFFGNRPEIVAYNSKTNNQCHTLDSQYPPVMRNMCLTWALLAPRGEVGCRSRYYTRVFMDLTSAASLRDETISVKLDDSITHLFSRVVCCENSTLAILRLIFLNSNFSEFIFLYKSDK